MQEKYIAQSAKDTQRIGEDFAKEAKSCFKEKALVFGLQGNLGAGKTTFLQGFAKGLGIKEKVLSPTFVILKRFAVKKVLRNFYHIDCYRLRNENDILELNFKEIIEDPKNIVAIEWPDIISSVLPKETIFIDFKIVEGKDDCREIIFKM